MKSNFTRWLNKGRPKARQSQQRVDAQQRWLLHIRCFTEGADEPKILTANQRGPKMIQLNLFDYFAPSSKVLSLRPVSGTYFIHGTDAFKRSVGGSWSKLDVILGVPKFGYRNLRKGYQLLQPDYVGSHWITLSPEEALEVQGRYETGSMSTVDSHITADLSKEWKWEKLRKELDGAVARVTAPDGGTIRLQKIPGRKAKWIYAVAFFAPSGESVVQRELGAMAGVVVFGKVSAAQDLVRSVYNENVIELQSMIRDANSGMNFGKDRSWETSSAEMLARKMVYFSKSDRKRPLEPEELIRLLELNGRRNRTGRFSSDRNENLSLDHLYAELLPRFLAFGFIHENVWGNGPAEWRMDGQDRVHSDNPNPADRYRKGNYFVRLSGNKNNETKWKIEKIMVTNGPHVPGNFKTAERAMAAADKRIFNLSFAEREVDLVKGNFKPIKAEIMAAGDGAKSGN